LSYNFIFELRSCYTAQAGLKLSILLPQPPKCWDYSCEPPYLAVMPLKKGGKRGSHSKDEGTWNWEKIESV
jgi:hypothetical protein